MRFSAFLSGCFSRVYSCTTDSFKKNVSPAKPANKRIERRPNVAKISMAFALSGALLLLGAQLHSQEKREEGFTFYSSQRGTTLACSQTNLVIPHAIYERAKLKAELINLLRASLEDDAKSIVNIEREKRIRKIANDLRKE